MFVRQVLLNMSILQSHESMREFFSDLYPEILVGLLEVKLMKVLGPLKGGIPGIFISSYSTFNPQQLMNYCLSFPTSCWFLVVFAPSKLWFSVFAHLSNVHGSNLPCDLNSLTDLRKVVDFLAFFLVRMGVMATKLFTHLTGNKDFFYVSYGAVIEDYWLRRKWLFLWVSSSFCTLGVTVN